MTALEQAELVRQATLIDYRIAVLPLLYLDPGTGSMVFQWVIAGVVGGAFALKMFGRRVMTWFRNRRDEHDGQA